ncbi:hypothetical protein KM043_012327 [Ampulex compressa]|nr:hypothetical protein KM043_012327 [Ampulex compressa]
MPRRGAPPAERRPDDGPTTPPLAFAGAGLFISVKGRAMPKQCNPHDKETDYWGGGRGAKQGYEAKMNADHGQLQKGEDQYRGAGGSSSGSPPASLLVVPQPLTVKPSHPSHLNPHLGGPHSHPPRKYQCKMCPQVLADDSRRKVARRKEGGARGKLPKARSAPSPSISLESLPSGASRLFPRVLPAERTGRSLYGDSAAGCKTVFGPPPDDSRDCSSGAAGTARVKCRLWQIERSPMFSGAFMAGFYGCIP